jgi:hypothetical protein
MDPFGALVTRIRIERVEYGRLRLCFTTCACHSRMILWEYPQAKATITMNCIIVEFAQRHIFGTICGGERGSLGSLFKANPKTMMSTTFEYFL